MAEQRKLLTVDEVAAQLGVSRWTVFKLKREKKLPHIDMGPRIVRFDQCDVDALIKQQKSA
jgi:excisionase family DNA binding protein